MDKLYDKINNELLQAIKKYYNDEIQYEELVMINEKEELLANVKEWDKIREEMKNEIFLLTKRLYDEISDIQKDIACIERMDVGQEIEVDKEALLSHSLMLSRNTAEGIGGWYLPPFPTLEMVENLKNKD